MSEPTEVLDDLKRLRTWMFTRGDNGCRIPEAAIALIERLEADNARLRAETDRLRLSFAKLAAKSSQQQAEIERLNEDVVSLATDAYDAAEPEPMSNERINEIVAYVLERTRKEASGEQANESKAAD